MTYDRTDDLVDLTGVIDLHTTQHPSCVSAIWTTSAIIRRVGPESTVIAIDLDQADKLAPVDGVVASIALLQAEDFDEPSIKCMYSNNTAALLEL